MGEAVLRLERISKSFGKHKVLRSIDLDVNKGEILGIIGASGSGKTTLLNIMAGFLPPTKGQAQFRSTHVVEYDDEAQKQAFQSVIAEHDEVKRLIGFASQEPSFYAQLNLKENLDLFGALYDLSADARETNALILLKLMGLFEFQKTLAANLSGGMQKRLDIACALIHDPHILILDEPTADLDPHLRTQMWKLIKKINSKGTTIILSSHFLDELEELCDRVAILYDGTVRHEGTPAELKRMVSADEEVLIETLKGDYETLLSACKPFSKNYISEVHDYGHELLLRTGNAHALIERLLKVMEKNKDVMISLHVNRPTLNKVFEKLMLHETKRQEKKVKKKG
jgi:ABC-2 type transport system ATP-binding protein